MIQTILRQEWWLIKQHSYYRLLGLMLLFCVALSIWNGNGIYQKKINTHIAVDSVAAQTGNLLKAQLREIENKNRYEGSPVFDPRYPSVVGNRFYPHYMVYPLHPLAQWSIGQSDVQPTYYKITAGKMQALTFNDEIANPQVQFTGYFDLAFVLVYLLPLFIVAFNYNISASESELGTLKLLLSQPISFHTILGIKFLFRFFLTSVLLWLSLSIAAVVCKIPFQDGKWGQFCFHTWLYSLVWFAVSFLINALSRKNSGTTASILVTCWLFAVLFTPGIINLLASSRYPIPSRIDLITETREAASEVTQRSSEVLGKYLQDHPELVKDTTKINPNDFAIKSFTAVLETEKITSPLQQRFEVQLNKQQRLAGIFGYLSPALLMQSALNNSAGTDENNFGHFKTDVNGFFKSNRDYFTQRVVTQEMFSSKDVEEIPIPTSFRLKSATCIHTELYFAALSFISIIAGFVVWRSKIS